MRCASYGDDRVKTAWRQYVVTLLCSIPSYIGVVVAEAIGSANAEAVQNNPAKLTRLDFISSRIIDTDVTLIHRVPVAITGKLSVSRSKFESELQEYGFVISDIKTGVAYLITNDPNSGSAKNQKADELGIPKITEAEFRAKYMEVLG